MGFETEVLVLDSSLVTVYFQTVSSVSSTYLLSRGITLNVVVPNLKLISFSHSLSILKQP